MKTDWRREAVGGVTTFAAMSYILVVNPHILSQCGMDRGALITVTALAIAVGTLLMAVATNFPIAMAPGMGINSYFAFVVCMGMGIPWPQALGMVFWNGVLFLLLSVTGARKKLIEAIPEPINLGIQCGIGFFIAFIGLKNAGIIVAHPATFVTLGQLGTPQCMLMLLGLFLMLVLTIRRVPGAIFLTIILLTLVGAAISVDGKPLVTLPASWCSLPASVEPLLGKLDIWYPFTHFVQSVHVIFTLLLLSLFDALGALVGLTRRAGITTKDGSIPKVNRALAADALSSIACAFLGTSPNVAFIESATGIEAGGRTGLCAAVTTLCFLGALFFTPIIAVVPAYATAPALVLVGIFMLQALRHVHFDDLTHMAPAILTAITIPLTFSITEGIGLGLLTYTALMLSRNPRGIPVTTYLLVGLFALHYALSR